MTKPQDGRFRWTTKDLRALFLVGLTVFMLGHLTGDPVRLMVPDQATEADIETRMKQGFSVFIMNWGDAGFRAIDIGRRVSGR